MCRSTLDAVDAVSASAVVVRREALRPRLPEPPPPPPEPGPAPTALSRVLRNSPPISVFLRDVDTKGGGDGNASAAAAAPVLMGRRAGWAMPGLLALPPHDPSALFTSSGREKKPLFGRQEKYRLPPTCPSWLPAVLSRARPTQQPSAKATWCWWW
jgi:hypothetical protein